MPSVTFYFQVHQPYRLKHYTYQNVGHDHVYFDDEKNGAILKKVAGKCYIPMNRLLLDLIKEYQGDFKVSFSITGTAIEQMADYSPEALDTFKALADTGCVEFIGETYYHSLSAVFNPEEFREQVRLHTQLMQKMFGCTPSVFRNTELIYEDRIGRLAGELGFKGIIAEGVDDVLGWRSPNFIYKVPETETRLLLKNYRLSDDVAFRFSSREWDGWPLTAEKFASWVHRISGNGEMVGLFVDYETFGEHQWESTGIFEFMRHLPRFILAHPDWNFATPSEAIERYNPVADLHFHRLTSWADVDRDLTAWRGNRMQESALRQIYDHERLFDGSPYGSNVDPKRLENWRKLQTSDHFYYMCTKWFADGDVHAYFSPYESPYDAFIAYMNVLRDFRGDPEGAIDEVAA